MIKAIIFKEWTKTRTAFLIGLALTICLTAFELLSMNRVAMVKGVEHIWQIMLMKDNVFVNHLPFMFLVIGVGIGLMQMLPEMELKRFKLTLHLPFPQNKMVALMLLFGLAEVVVLSLLSTLVVAFYDTLIITHELVVRVLLTMLPWQLCGICAYFFTAAVCIEGQRMQRIALSLIGVGCISLFFIGDAPEAYNTGLAFFMLLAMLSSLLVFRSVYRFKEGHQD